MINGIKSVSMVDISALNDIIKTDLIQKGVDLFAKYNKLSEFQKFRLFK